MRREVVNDLVRRGVLLVEDGNHGEYRPRPGEFVSSGTSFIRAADMTSGTIDFDAAEKISAIARARIRKGIGSPGDIVLSHKGTVGRVAVAPIDSPEYVCSPQTTFWRSLDSDVLNQQYLRYVMQSPDFTRQLEVLKGQTDMAPYVSLTDQRSIKLNIPTIADQLAISEVLGALDDKIAANGRTVTVASQLARAIFGRAAVRGRRVTIRDIAQSVTRGVTPSYTETKGITVLNQKCVRNQKVSLAPARRTLTSSERSDKLLQRHDVLVNSTGQGTLGRTARWVYDTRATVDSHISIVRFDSALVDPVCAGFGVLQVEAQIEGLAEGSTGQTELRRDLLAGMEIVVPDNAAQVPVGAELASLDDLSTGVQQESDRLAATRDELLPLLMSGKLRVKDTEKVVSDAV